MTRASDLIGDTPDDLIVSPPPEAQRSLRDRVAALESALEAALGANSRLRDRTVSLELEVFGAVQE